MIVSILFNLLKEKYNLELILRVATYLHIYDTEVITIPDLSNYCFFPNLKNNVLNLMHNQFGLIILPTYSNIENLCRQIKHYCKLFSKLDGHHLNDFIYLDHYNFTIHKFINNKCKYKLK